MINKNIGDFDLSMRDFLYDLKEEPELPFYHLIRISKHLISVL